MNNLNTLVYAGIGWVEVVVGYIMRTAVTTEFALVL